MSSESRILLAFAAAVLAGCAKYVPPEPPLVPPPDQWSRATGSASVDSQWWMRFGDPQLNGLVAEALAKNVDIRLAASRLREARAVASIQGASQLPTLDLAATGARARTISPVNGLPYEATSHQTQFQASYELDVWGRVDATVEGAKAATLSAAAQRDAVALSIVATLADTYFSLLRVDAQLAIARQTLGTRERSLALMRSRELRGQSSALERAQSEAELHNTAQAIPALTQTRERLLASLNVLLMRPPGDIRRGVLKDLLMKPELPPGGLPSELLRRRPDIYAAEADLMASDAQLAAARAQLLPSMRITGTLGRAGSTILHSGPFTVWSLGGSVLAPIFNGGRLRAQVTIADTHRERALFVYERAVMSAFSEVETQLGGLENTEAQLLSARAEEAALKDALRIATRRYQAGYASFLDQLLAERNLFLAEQNVAALSAGVFQAEVALYRALGGGWEVDRATAETLATGLVP